MKFVESKGDENKMFNGLKNILDNKIQMNK